MSLLRINEIADPYRNCDHNQCVDIHINCGSHDRQPIIIIIISGLLPGARI